MSLLCTGAGNRALFIDPSTISPGTGDYTILCGVNNLTDLNRFADFFGLTISLDAAGDYISCGTDSNGTDFTTFLESTGQYTNYVASTATGYWIAVQRTGTTGHFKVFPDTKGVTTPLVDRTRADSKDWAAVTRLILGEMFTGESPNANMANLKYYKGRYLSDAECSAEFDSPTVVSTTNIYGAWTLADTTNGFTDTSGNGRNLTNSGLVNGSWSPNRLASGITGTGAVTLPSPIAAATGIRGLLGSAAVALTALTIAASGTVTNPGVSGSAAVTLPAVQVAASGTNQITGTGAVTLVKPTVAGTGIAGNRGPAAVTLPTLAISGSGSVGQVVTGTGAVSLPALQLAFGDNVTLPRLTVSGTGIVGNIGSAAVTLPALQVNGVSSSNITGAGAVTLPSLVVSGTGKQTNSGSAAVQLPALVLAATGSQPITGSAAVTLPALALSGTGSLVGVSTGNPVLPTLILAGTGTVIAPVTGTGAVALPTLSVSGLASLIGVVTGVADVTLTAPVCRSYGRWNAIALNATDGEYRTEHDSALKDLQEAGE